MAITGTTRRAFMATTAAAALGATLALSGCGSGEGSGKTTITFWDNNGGPARTPIYQQLIKEFEAANPDIHVEYVGVPIASVQQKYDTAIIGGSGPDVGGVTTSYLADLVGQDALEPIDDRLAKSSLNGKLLDNLVQTARDTVPDHKLYQVPATANLDVIWYRKDLFGPAGVTEPKTWDEFFQDTQKLTDRGKKAYGYTIRGGSGSIFQVLSEMYAYSGVTTFFDDQGKSTVNDPRNVEMLQKIAGMYKQVTPEADVNNGFPEMVAQFENGSVSMMHHNLGSYADHVKAHGAQNVGAFALPVSLDGVRTVVPNPVDGFSVFKASKHKDAAWKFVEFLVSHKSNSFWNEKVGQIPANRDAQNDPWLTQNAPVKMAQQVLADPKTVIVPAPVYLPEFSTITKADTEPLFQKVLLGTMSAQDFADKLAGELTKAQADWDKHNK